MAQERECNEGCQLTKLLFSFNLEITEEGMERQQENRYTVGPLIQYSSPSRLLHLQLCQVAGRMVNNRIPLEVYKNLSIKRNCVALPRCSLGRKVLERVSQYQMVVGWSGKQAVLNMRSFLRFPSSKLACIIYSCEFQMRVSSWERGSMQSLLTGTKGMASE